VDQAMFPSGSSFDKADRPTKEKFEAALGWIA
jgi:hypothetical protein